MQISGTGNLSNRTGHQGFTLFEILVVLILIGIIVSSVSLSIDPRQEKLETEVERLAALLKLVGQEAVLTGVEYAAAFPTGEYRFYRWQDNQWLLIRENIYRPRRLPEGFTFALSLPGESMDQDDFTGSESSSQRIYLLSSGAITPFRIDLRDPSNRILYSIRGSSQGNIKLVDGYDDR